MFQITFIEKIKTHFLFITFFLFRKWYRVWNNVEKWYRVWNNVEKWYRVWNNVKKSTVCEIMWKNGTVCEMMWKKFVEPNRTHITIWHLRIACSIFKARYPHSEYVTHIVFPLQQWLHEPTVTLTFICVLLSCFINIFTFLQYAC
jgi:hypothetical protein